MGQFQLLLRLYYSPSKSFSRILDEGKFVFALVAAAAVLFVLQAPRAAEYQRQRYEAAMRILRARMESAYSQGSPVPDGEVRAYLDEAMRSASGGLLPNAVERLTGENPTRYFTPLVALAVCFVPIAILILTYWDNLGGFQTILFRDYVALLVCCLFAWTAPYLLVLALHWGMGAFQVSIGKLPVLWWGAEFYFLLLAVLAIRTLFGVKFPHAIGAVVGGWMAAVGGICLYAQFGNLTAYLASPFLLYYLYAGLSPQLSGLGASLLSRQRFKRHLEIATLNPRDADAHYQLGLIYAQRRQYASAAERFRKAIEIDPSEADPYYQLGRMAREQGRYSEAIENCFKAARIDDKHASSEVWREIGVASFLAGETEQARQALEKYVERRPYDPEGACWYGRTMARLGYREEARAAFRQAIESVRTMPAARKRQVRNWESEARREMKKLAAGKE